MAPLSNDRRTATKVGIGYPGSALLDANVIAYEGGLAAANANGYAAPASTTAGTRVIGVFQGQTSNSGGGAGAVRAAVKTGIFLFDMDATNPPTQADVWRHVFVKDDHTVQVLIGGSSVIAGVLVEIDPQGRGAWVYVSPEVCDIGGGLVDVTSDNSTGPGIPIEHTFVIADAATAAYPLVIQEKFQVQDVIVRKTGAGAGNTAQVFNGTSATPITDAIAAAVDKAVTRCATIDPAQEVIAAGGTLGVEVTRAAGSGAMQVTIIGRKVA